MQSYRLRCFKLQCRWLSAKSVAPCYRLSDRFIVGGQLSREQYAQLLKDNKVKHLINVRVDSEPGFDGPGERHIACEHNASYTELPVDAATITNPEKFAFWVKNFAKTFGESLEHLPSSSSEEETTALLHCARMPRAVTVAVAVEQQLGKRQWSRQEVTSHLDKAAAAADLEIPDNFYEALDRYAE
ncbi:MAG: hypothetical protein MHM6MM_004336 [Cercozoa sp. M6MM]